MLSKKQMEQLEKDIRETVRKGREMRARLEHQGARVGQPDCQCTDCKQMRTK